VHTAITTTPRRLTHYSLSLSLSLPLSHPLARPLRSSRPVPPALPLTPSPVPCVRSRSCAPKLVCSRARAPKIGCHCVSESTRGRPNDSRRSAIVALILPDCNTHHLTQRGPPTPTYFLSTLARYWLFY
jgi:hypothetical protein